jgi:hypothetical protein
VIENTPGLPGDDSEPTIFETLIEANEVAYARVNELIEEGYALTTFEPADNGDGPIFAKAERTDTVAPDLGRVIEVRGLADDGEPI